jgi:hypothetical protein
MTNKGWWRKDGAAVQPVAYHSIESSTCAIRGQHSLRICSRVAQQNPSTSGVGLPVA